MGLETKTVKSVDEPLHILDQRIHLLQVGKKIWDYEKQ